jgi:hypothetical protein
VSAVGDSWADAAVLVAASAAAVRVPTTASADSWTTNRGKDAHIHISL